MEQAKLFRTEVFESRRAQSIGAIRLDQPIPGMLVAVTALALSAALVCFIVFGSVTKKARVAGLVVPVAGTVGITAPASGVLVHSRVKEGERVEEGQVLFALSTEKQGIGGELTALVAQQLEVRRQSLAEERRARVHQDEEKRRELDDKLRNAEAENRQLDHELDIAERRQDLARASVRQYETLQAGGFVSSSQSRQKQEDLLDAASRLASLQRTRVQLAATMLSLRAEREGLATKLAGDLAQIDNSLASVNQEIAENAGRKTALITAPKTGTVTAIGYQLGQSVNQGQTIATLIPASGGAAAAPDLEVQLFVPSKMAGFIAAGQEVLIRYKAFPYQMYGLHPGRVIDVSATPFTPSELPPNLASVIVDDLQQSVQGYSGKEGLFRVRVRLVRQSIQVEGRQRQLVPGMALDADIVEDRRRIWQWILQPALAAVGHL
ncbi:MAG: HlyD family secretion protein [Telluria sp.]